jgi:hypothetical protein
MRRFAKANGVSNYCDFMTIVEWLYKTDLVQE